MDKTILLKGYTKALNYDDEKFKLGTCVFLPNTGRIICTKNHVLFLTPNQNKLLYHLCPPGKVATTEELYKQLWAHEGYWQNNLDVLICGLRKKLSRINIRIANIRGFGFQLHIINDE